MIKTKFSFLRVIDPCYRKIEMEKFRGDGNSLSFLKIENEYGGRDSVQGV